MLASSIPLSLYIHIPWCIKKCPYCDFNSHQQPSDFEALESIYINRLIHDFIEDLPLVSDRTLHSIFIGGGTPSLFSPKAFDKLLSSLAKQIHFDSNLEITLEVNPGAIERDKFVGFKSAGINRVSIGVQSFNDTQLKKIGRIHSQQDARLAIGFAKEAGFKQINVDLMHGLSHQTLSEALNDISIAISYEPSHISWYQLTLEPNTVFYKHPPPLPHDDLIADMQQQGAILLNQAQFKQYEISAWSQSGCESKHNLNYWRFGDYLGIGAGAHGKYTHFKDQKVSRRWKVKMPATYLKSSVLELAQEKILLADELPLEFFMNAFRMNEGVPTPFFLQRTGLALSSIQATLNKMLTNHWIYPYQTLLKPTPFGQLFLNNVLAEWMS